MKKKVLALVLSAAMLAGLLAGCGSSSSTGGTAGTGTGGTETAAPAAEGNGSDASASTGEVVKLKALIISHSLTKDITEMKWVSEIEEKAGVEIEWEQIRADWETVKSTRFAAGDIPDLLFNATADSDYTKYA